MTPPPQTRLALRLGTLRAMAALALARICIRILPFSRWRGSLGEPAEDPVALAHVRPEANEQELAEARALARRVERAASRLPGESKCLPKAMALQWMLHRRSIPSRLVIAVLRQQGERADAYHAWVECGADMVIGHCDRTEYTPLACFEQRAGLSMRGAS